MEKLGGVAGANIWIGEARRDRSLAPTDMFLAVYAAGGGKRNMANFTREPLGVFFPGDVHVHVASAATNPLLINAQLFMFVVPLA